MQTEMTITPEDDDFEPVGSASPANDGVLAEDLDGLRDALIGRLTEWAFGVIADSVSEGEAMPFSTLDEGVDQMLDAALANLRAGGAIQFDSDTEEYVGVMSPSGQWLYADDAGSELDSDSEQASDWEGSPASRR